MQLYQAGRNGAFAAVDPNVEACWAALPTDVRTVIEGASPD